MELSGWDWIWRLAVAGMLSGIIGFEREAHHKAAGLRTHMLVGMGSALFALAGLESLGATDTSRMAAGVVTGVGFLGAGAIFRQGVSVRGLTTAAGLWVVAAIGIVAGAGDLLPATTATLLAAVTLNGVSLVERAVRLRSDRRSARLVVHMSDPRVLGDALKLMRRVDERARDCDIHMTDDGVVLATFLVPHPNVGTMRALMAALDGVTGVEESAGA